MHNKTDQTISLSHLYEYKRHNKNFEITTPCIVKLLKNICIKCTKYKAVDDWNCNRYYDTEQTRKPKQSYRHAHPHRQCI